MNTHGPYITGIGIVSPLGDNARATWDALLAGKFIVDHAPFAGAAHCRLTTAASRAATEAAREAGWSDAVLQDDGTALIVGTSKGPVHRWLTTDRPVEHGGGFGLEQLAHELAIRLRLGYGPRLTLSAACASSLHALIRAVLMLRSGQARRAIVVGAEASVHPLFIASFNRLGVLPRDGRGCRPFDQQRQGFLMSDAAAAVCLEIGESLRSSPNVAIDRVALLGEAHHLTSVDAGGVVLRRALGHVVGDREVQLIHAHGTGTELNDPAELNAIEAAAQSGSPLIYSHKGALGHSLGASGLLAVALNCLMHRYRGIPGNVQTTRPLPTRRVRIVRDAMEHSIARSLCVAGGFGGAVAAVSLTSRPE